jgi:four helix bundle protein
MSFIHENLEIYSLAKEFNGCMYEIIKDFPSDERYNLVDQIRRASTSVVLNIAEGSASQYSKDTALFINHSIRSLAEVIAALDTSVNLGFLTAEKYVEMYGKADILARKMGAYKKYKLKNKVDNVEKSKK